MHETAARQRTVRRRHRDSRRVDFGADATSLEDVPQILDESVADVDRSRRRPERRETLPGIQSRMRTQESLDEIFYRRAIFFRIATSLQVPREDAPAERRVAKRAGHKDLVANSRRIAPHHSAPSLTGNRNRD